MRGFLRLAMGLLGVIATLLPAGPAQAWDSRPLQVGLFPYLSTHAVLTIYHPLQAYLQKRLQRPVLLVTAPDMKTFVERTQKGEYRFVITAPHFARLAQTDAGYVPMLRVDKQLYGLLVVAKNSPIRGIGALRGKVVSMPNRMAIISMLGVQLLRENGLRPGRDVFIRQAASHNSAVLSVLHGASAAAITSETALHQMPEEVRSGVRTLAVTRNVPHVMYLANPDVPPRAVARMTRIILDFIHSPEGRKFVRNTGYVGLRPPTAAELRSLDPYVADLKILLSQP